MSASNFQKTAPVTITRPADTTAYAAGDVINGNGSTSMIPITLNAREDQNCWIVGGQCIDSVSQSSLAFDVLFFSSSFTIAADNSAFAPSDSNLSDYYLGRVSFSTFVAYSVNSVADGVTATQKPIVITPNGQTIYAVIVATGSYTPASSEQITLKFDYQPID